MESYMVSVWNGMSQRLLCRGCVCAVSSGCGPPPDPATGQAAAAFTFCYRCGLLKASISQVTDWLARCYGLPSLLVIIYLFYPLPEVEPTGKCMRFAARPPKNMASFEQL
jgi:hypothetical protein